ncbi:MAG: hypothetical protein AB7E61_02960 [Acholeplasmataceae bacterium]
MEIVNYKGIKNFKYEETKINIFYGQNGIGKTTIKDVISFSALGEQLPENKNIDLMEQPSIIVADVFKNGKVLKFDEEYVGQYVYNQGSLKDSNKYQVLFSKALIDKTKEEAAEITKLLHENNNILNDLIAAFYKQDKMFNDYFSNSGIKTKLKNITKIEVDSEINQEALSFTKSTSDQHIWWRDGYQKYWDTSKKQCIFCNQNIANSPIKEILENKKNSNINHTTQTKFLNETNIFNEVLSEDFSDTIEKLKTAVIDSYSKDVTTELTEVKDELLPFIQLYQVISSKKARISSYIYRFESLNLVDLEIENYEDIVNEEYKNLIADYNENLKLIEKAKEDYELKLTETKELLAAMIKKNEMLFNEILRTFGLNYKIQIPEDGLDINLEMLNYSFNLLGNDESNSKNIIDESSRILSFGEKNTLAFAFFLIECFHELNNRSKDKIIVILDDPISSHDIFRKYSTVDLINEYIVKKLSSSDHLFLFTHEFEFILPIKETIVKFINSINPLDVKLNGLNFENNKIDVFKLTGQHFTNSIIRMKKNINNGEVNVISKIVMMRILREIDCLLYNIDRRTDNLFSFFSDIIHSKNTTTTINSSEYNEFKNRYKLTFNLHTTTKEYETYYNQVNFDEFKEIDKYYYIRPYIEYLLSKEELILIDGSYNDYSDKNLVHFINKNFSFLNSSVHQKTNEDEISFNDIKEFEMFSSKMFNEFRKIVEK